MKIKEIDEQFSVYCKESNIFFIDRLFFLIFSYDDFFLSYLDLDEMKISNIYILLAKMTVSALVKYCTRNIRLLKLFKILYFYFKYEIVHLDEEHYNLLQEIEDTIKKQHYLLSCKIEFKSDFEKYVKFSKYVDFDDMTTSTVENMKSLIYKIFYYIKEKEKNFLYF
ncbi:hypothetical protein COBT_003411 [Conglomerata obtusa]